MPATPRELPAQESIEEPNKTQPEHKPVLHGLSCIKPLQSDFRVKIAFCLGIQKKKCRLSLGR